MKDVQFVARGRLGWEQWKLGDAILACSVLADLGDVRLHVENPDTAGNKLLWDLSSKVFNDKYNLEIVQRKDAVPVVHPDQYFLENNLSVVRYALPTGIGADNEYVTTQSRSRAASRSVSYAMIDQFIEPDMKRIDLNQSEGSLSLPDLFNLVGAASKHVGAASGICWVAMSTLTQTMCLMPSSFRHGSKGWDYALECMYRSPSITIKDL